MSELISDLPNVGIQRDEIEARLVRAQEAAGRRNLDALLVVGRSFYDRPGNLAYLTNHFPPFPSTANLADWQGMGHSFLLLPASGDPSLIADGRAYREDLVAIQDGRTDTNLPRGVSEAIHEKVLTQATIGLVGEDLLPLSIYRSLTERLPGVTWEPASGIVESMRRIKSPKEQELLQRGADVSGLGLRAALDAIGHGVTELEVNAVGTAAAMRAGADFIRYLRVHSGHWSGFGSRWPQASDRQMKKGELVAMDIIGAVQGYGFDVLRTTIVGWDTLPEQRKMCEAVLHAVAATLDKARAGVTCGELVRAGLKVMEDAGYGQYANRFMGHGIGLETVEAPLLVPDSEVMLEPGMVLCIEPGIFIRGTAGCSIEEEVIITEDEPVVMTDVSRRLWE